MSGLSEFFQAIRKAPGLYWGDGPPLTCLQAFLVGHQFGSGDDPKSPLALPNDFSGWVAYRTGASSTYNWRGMLLSIWPDEEEAFHRFFDLLEEHVSRKGCLVAKVTGHGKFRIRYDVSDLPRLTPIGKDYLPDPIFLTTYTSEPGFLATDSEGHTVGIWGNWISWDRLARFYEFTDEHLKILDPEEFERIRG